MISAMVVRLAAYVQVAARTGRDRLPARRGTDDGDAIQVVILTLAGLLLAVAVGAALTQAVNLRLTQIR